MLASGADIRVADSNKCAPIYFWIETGTMNTASTKIWVKVPSIPAASSIIIYLYYGNPAAAAAANADSTFLFFDDFSGGTSKWTWSPPNSAMTIAGGVAHITSTVNRGASQNAQPPVENN